MTPYEIKKRIIKEAISDFNAILYWIAFLFEHVEMR